MVQYKRVSLFCMLLCQIFLYVDCVRIPAENYRVSNNCLACICQASSDCKSSRYNAGGIQGFFRMTQPYWMDAGQPVLPSESANSPGAYENCANNRNCAAKAVKAYMERYAKDCNGDGKTDCEDYAAIHRLGPYACNQGLPEEFKIKYFTCKSFMEGERNESI